MSSARRLASPVEVRPVIGSSLDDLDQRRLRKYFRTRFPDRSPADEWAPALAAHKLVALTDVGPAPTCLGILERRARTSRQEPGDPDPTGADAALHRSDERVRREEEPQRIRVPDLRRLLGRAGPKHGIR